MNVVLYWFRRDLRLQDNVGLFNALSSGLAVQPIFVFDTCIIDQLPRDDARVSFIYEALGNMQESLKRYNASLLVLKGDPKLVIPNAIRSLKNEGKNVVKVFANKDYEPYGISRDKNLKGELESLGVPFLTYCDHLIFEPGEILKSDAKPYTVYTPFKKRWLERLETTDIADFSCTSGNFVRSSYTLLDLESLGFSKSSIQVKGLVNVSAEGYAQSRDIPNLDATSYAGAHLRFGTVSIRKLVQKYQHSEGTYLSELIWREFFIQILYFFPDVVKKSFKAKYDRIVWENNEELFVKWCEGKTGYPIVDAGMRQLNATGYMHNRVRMIVASFLCKHLLTDWRWGEAYFAEKLLDFELASNNGNWQWAAGTGCDAAPYFRVFNPTLQQQKFDKDGAYIRTWVKDIDELSYPSPIVEHRFARERAIARYKEGIQ